MLPTLSVTSAVLLLTVSFTSAASIPRSTPTKFLIQPSILTADDPSSFSDLYLTSFHVGAGESTLVTTSDVSEAITFFIDPSTTYLEGNLSTSLPPAALQLSTSAPYMSSAPSGYDYIAFNYGTTDATPGFGITHDAGTTNFYAGYSQVGNEDFAAWALCHVNGTSPYWSVGPQTQFLWKTKEASMDYAVCADVALRIIEVD